RALLRGAEAGIEAPRRGLPSPPGAEIPGLFRGSFTEGGLPPRSPGQLCRLVPFPDGRGDALCLSAGDAQARRALSADPCPARKSGRTPGNRPLSRLRTAAALLRRRPSRATPLAPRRSSGFAALGGGTG